MTAWLSVESTDARGSAQIGSPLEFTRLLGPLGELTGKAFGEKDGR
jgi:hypothetical protein